jgi:lipopolysaccharide export system protein LptA
MGLAVALLVMLLLTLATVDLAAQQSPLSAPLNSQAPIQITADAMEADNRNQTFLFRGHVKVVQEQTVITADQLKVWYRSEGEGTADGADGSTSRIREIEAQGNVVILFDGRTAKSDKAIYATEAQTLTLVGNKATIVDGPNTISGTKITLYRAQDRIKVEGGGDKRVEAVFFPNQSDRSE